MHVQLWLQRVSADVYQEKREVKSRQLTALLSHLTQYFSFRYFIPTAFVLQYLSLPKPCSEGVNDCEVMEILVKYKKKKEYIQLKTIWSNVLL